MTASLVLVFGGTGPAGICLLRELLYRGHATRVYARNPSKIPEDLTSNPLLEVIKGEITDTDALSAAVAGTTAIVSLLGPNSIFNLDPATYTSFYARLFPLMRAHAVRRIFSMSTLSYPQPADRFSLIRTLIVAFVFVVANRAWQTARGLARVFEEEAGGVDWTVFRIAGIPGGCSEEAWWWDRGDGEAFEGWVGERGWCASQRRGALARWLVDAVEDGKEQWIGKMPAVSRLAGSKRKDE